MGSQPQERVLWGVFPVRLDRGNDGPSRPETTLSRSERVLSRSERILFRSERTLFRSVRGPH